jgi:hypothetical protein
MDRAWDWLGYGLITGIVIGLITVIGCVIGADKTVDDYYLQSSTLGSAVSYQIMNDINWSVDTRAYSTTDGDEALKVLERLKGTLNE